MYASLVTAGASALYDLYKSATDTTKPSTSSAAFPSTSSSTTDAPASGAASTSGSKFSDALQKLFTDLQASTSATTDTTSADATSTVADDLKSISKDLKSAGGHGHKGHPPSDISQSSTTGDTSSPFQGLASSLVAYAKTQGLGASGGTSITA